MLVRAQLSVLEVEASEATSGASATAAVVAEAPAEAAQAQTGVAQAPAATSGALSPASGLPITGAAAVLNILLAEGVNTVFDYPGGAIIPIYDALHDFAARLSHVLVRHEQGGIHAAQGYARAPARVGVGMATSGPGATNLVTGLAMRRLTARRWCALRGRYLRTCWAPMPSRKPTLSTSRCQSRSRIIR